MGSSAYDVTSSAGGSGGSQYIGPAASHFGASQLSEGPSFNGGAGGVAYGNAAMSAPYNGAAGGVGGMGAVRGTGGSGGIGGRASSGGSGLGTVPPYNPNALPAGTLNGAPVGGIPIADRSAGMGMGASAGGVGARGSGPVGGVYMSSNRGRYVRCHQFFLERCSCVSQASSYRRRSL